MSDEGRETSKDVRSTAEKSFDQARAAFEKFLANAQATAGSVETHHETARAGAKAICAKDIGAKVMSYAEKNIQASLDYAQALLCSRDLSDVMRLHSDQVQAQIRANSDDDFTEQARERGQIVSRVLMEAAKPKKPKI